MKPLVTESDARPAPKPEASAPEPLAITRSEVVTPPAAPLQEPTLGTTQFHIAGFGVGTFEARNGSVSNFSATFNPIFLWELSPKLLFESRLEIELSGSAKGAAGWIKVTEGSVYLDHPVHAPFGHSLNIDFLAPELGPSGRVAVELSQESARALAKAIEAVLESAPPGLE